MPNSGPLTKDALMSLLGDHCIQLDEMVNVLIDKDVRTEQAWDDALNRRFIDDKRPASYWAEQSLDPDDRVAVNDFFG
jgi:hypothetical protein